MWEAAKVGAPARARAMDGPSQYEENDKTPRGSTHGVLHYIN